MIDPKEIVGLNLAKRIAICEDGQVCPVTTMLNTFGDETDDVDDAIVLIVKVADEHWTVVNRFDFTGRTN
jgi:hypothetical protein